MNIRQPRRSYAGWFAVAGALTFLTACGTSPPPLDEFTHEVIDSASISDEAKGCMHAAFDAFRPTVEELEAANLDPEADLEAVLERADSAKQPPPTNETGELTDAAQFDIAAQAVVDRLQAELSACN